MLLNYLYLIEYKYFEERCCLHMNMYKFQYIEFDE